MCFRAFGGVDDFVPEIAAHLSIRIKIFRLDFEEAAEGLQGAIGRNITRNWFYVGISVIEYTVKLCV